MKRAEMLKLADELMNAQVKRRAEPQGEDRPLEPVVGRQP